MLSWRHHVLCKCIPYATFYTLYSICRYSRTIKRENSGRKRRGRGERERGEGAERERHTQKKRQRESTTFPCTFLDLGQRTATHLQYLPAECAPPARLAPAGVPPKPPRAEPPSDPSSEGARASLPFSSLPKRLGYDTFISSIWEQMVGILGRCEPSSFLSVADRV